MSTPAEKGMAGGWNLDLIMYDGVPIPPSIHDTVEKLKCCDVREDDIFLCTYPKTGTHWVWEILNMIVAGKAEYANHWLNYGFLEYRTGDQLAELESPRILHSHLPSRWLPEAIWGKKCKIVYIQRDPKDCMISRYCQSISQIWHDSHTNEMKQTFTGTIGDFMNIYLEGAVQFGSWFDHARDWESVPVKHPGTEMCTLQYEDLKKDTAKEIKKLAERPLPDKVYSEIAEACRFENLKHVSENVKDQTFHVKWREGTSGYFRKGSVGDWKTWLTVAQNETFDRVYADKTGKIYLS